MKYLINFPQPIIHSTFLCDLREHYGQQSRAFPWCSTVRAVQQKTESDVDLQIDRECHELAT